MCISLSYINDSLNISSKLSNSRKKTLAMDSESGGSAPMDLDLDASEKDLGLDRSPAFLTPPTAQDLDASKTSENPPQHSNQTTTGTDMDTSTSSTAKGNDSKTSDDQDSSNKKTPGKMDYDESLIRQVFECRNCDFKSEVLSAVSAHVELHKRPGPSNKPVWWPKYGIVDVPKEAPKEAPPPGLALPKHAEKWLKELNSAPDYPFKFISESKVSCQICEHTFVVNQKGHLTLHIKTKRHQVHVTKKEDKKEVQEKGTDLAKDLCKMACAANLAWNVFNNTIVREILEKHMGKKLPCATTVASRLDEIYNEVMVEIKKDLHGHPYWLSTDETNGKDSHAWNNVLSENVIGRVMWASPNW